MTTIREKRKETYFARDGGSPLTPLPPFPRTVLLELSNACNHACVFCANTHMRRPVGRMDETFVERILAESYTEGAREVGFYTTGEPFVHKKLEDLTDTARRLGYEWIFIDTNGALATPDRAKRVIDAGMTSIKFSINAGTRESYKRIHGRDEFDLVLKHLAFVARYRDEHAPDVHLAVSMVLTGPVIDEAEILRARVADYVDEFLVYDCGNQIGQMQAAAEILLAKPPEKRFKEVCQLPFSRLYVSQEGYLTLCCIDYHNYLAVLDLNKMSVGAAWAHVELQAIRQNHLDGKLAGSLCGTCWQGCKEEPQPLNTAFAHRIDHDRFHRGVRELTQERLKP